MEKDRWYLSVPIAAPSSQDAIGAGSRASLTGAPTVDLKAHEVINMGDVLITYKIMPDGVDVDLETIKNAVKEKLEGIAKINDFSEEPIAFGLKALIVRVIVKDEGGITDKIENMLSEIDNVQGVMVSEVTLI